MTLLWAAVIKIATVAPTRAPENPNIAPPAMIPTMRLMIGTNIIPARIRIAIAFNIEITWYSRDGRLAIETREGISGSELREIVYG